MPPLKAQLLLAESLAAYFPEMVFTDSGITVQLHRNTHQLHSISPVAWQHINMYGNFEFSPSTSKIDIDALVARYAEPEYWKQALIENENSSE